MKTISLDLFLKNIDVIAASQPTYQAGGDGTGGVCDCIGLIIGAIRRSGGSWSGTHGSNYAARYATENLAPLASAAQLTPGCLVYKTAVPGDSSYNLPTRYAQHDDQLDYYHVGVVRSTSPLEIIHCTTPGIVTDDTITPWSHFGWSSAVAQDGAAPAVTTATVTAESGATVNLRKTPGGALLCRVPVGAAVAVEEQGNTWSRITHGGQTGWMMTCFLRFTTEADRLTRLEQRVAALEERFSGGEPA